MRVLSDVEVQEVAGAGIDGSGSPVNYNSTPGFGG